MGLSLKLKQKGWRFEFAQNAIVYHDYRNNLIDFFRTFKNYGEGCRRAASRHLGEPDPHPAGTKGSPRRLITGGGYGYFGAQHTRPEGLSEQISFDVGAVRQIRLDVPERISFLALKMLQTVAYRYGWVQAKVWKNLPRSEPR